MAFRLARERGIDDPLAWYESLPDDVWTQWVAYDRVEPVGCEWEQHAALLAMTETLVAAIVNPHLEEKDRLKPRKAKEFLPPGFLDAKTSARGRPPLKRQLQFLAKVYGGAFGGNDNQ